MKIKFSAAAAAERLRLPLETVLPRVMRILSCSAAGFLAARAPVLGIYFPFACAWTVAVPYELLTAATIGALLGCVSMPPIISVSAACSVLFAVFTRRLLSEWKRLTAHPLFAPTVAGAARILSKVLIGGTALAELQPLPLLCEGVLAGGGAWFFTRAVQAMFRRGSFPTTDRTARVSVILGGGVLLAALSAFTVGPVSVGHIAALLLILFCAAYGRVASGCVAGTTVGILLILSGGMSEQFWIVYAVIGLTVGCFSALGRIPAAGMLVITTAVMLLMIPNAPSAALGESMVAALLFVIIPTRAIERLSVLFFPDPENTSPAYVRKSVVMRLNFAARAIAHVSQSVEEVSQQLLKQHPTNISAVYDRAVTDACDHCGLRMLCWQTQYEKTAEALNHVTPILLQKGRVSRTDLPDDLRTVCKRPDRMADAITAHYEDYLNNEAAEQRIAEIRGVVASQFRGVSDMLQELADSFRGQTVCDEKNSRAVRVYLEQSGWIPEGVVCSCDENDRMAVEICGRRTRHAETDLRVLGKELTRICGRRFGAPGVTYSDGLARISFSEQSAFAVDVGHAQHICSGAQLCGDHHAFFYDGGGRAVLMLSDGMGNGGRAAVDSAMACGILSRLILSGLGYDCALRIINSALYVKSGDESLATVDVATVDLYSGAAVFRKAGAAVGFLFSRNRVEELDMASLPAGILQDIRFASCERQLNAGDWIVLVSDGALSDGNEWLITQLRTWQGSAQELCDELLQTALVRRNDGHDDDITVAALHLQAVQ